MQYAAPIVSGGNLRGFAPPAGIIEKVICSLSGTEPSQWCRGGQYTEVFASDQPPLPASKDLFRRIKIDTWSGLEASAVCGEDFVDEVMAIRVDDPWARKWLESDQGQNWLESNELPRKPVFAPERECTANDPHPILEFSNLKDEDVIREAEFEVRGTADATGGFKGWALDFGQIDDPGTWYTVIESRQPVRDGVLSKLDLRTAQNGAFFLRLRMLGPNDAYAEKIIQLELRLPNPPTEIPPTEVPPTFFIPPTPTETLAPPTIAPPTETPTPTATEFPPTETPSPTPTETETPVLPPP